MAITQAGSTLTFANPGGTNTGTVSTTMTVPADAEIAIVGWSGFSNVVGYYSTGSMTLTKGGVDTAMTFGGVSWNGGAGPFEAIVFYMALPDTGTNKTLKWDWAGVAAPTDITNTLCSVTFWKGINTSSPVRVVGTGNGPVAVPYTTGSMAALSGDLIVAWAAWFTGGSAEGSINTWSNLSLLSQLTHSINADGAWATGSPSGSTTVAALTGTNATDGGIVALALAPAIAAAAIPPNALYSLNSVW